MLSTDSIRRDVIARSVCRPKGAKCDEAISALKSTDCFVKSNSLRSFDFPRNDRIDKGNDFIISRDVSTNRDSIPAHSRAAHPGIQVRGTECAPSLLPEPHPAKDYSPAPRSSPGALRWQRKYRGRGRRQKWSACPPAKSHRVPDTACAANRDRA